MLLDVKNQPLLNSGNLLRLVLYKGEVMRLPQHFKEIRAVAGSIWITAGGKDMMLSAGDTISLDTRKDFILVSTLHDTPAVIEAKSRRESTPEGVQLTPGAQARL